jgi:hypothetical protein
MNDEKDELQGSDNLNETKHNGSVGRISVRREACGQVTNLPGRNGPCRMTLV